MFQLILIACFAVCLGGQDLPAGSHTPAMFPRLEASNLNKQKVRFPEGLTGERNVLLLGFLREHQDDIDTWLAPLPALMSRHADVAYYELPVIDRSNFFFRWILRTGMRAGIPDKQQRARTVTLHLDKKKFRDALQVESEETIRLLVINKAGAVLWRTQGRADEAKLQALDAFLAAGEQR